MTGLANIHFVKQILYALHKIVAGKIVIAAK